MNFIYPNKDEGIKYVDCITALSKISPSQLAEILYEVNIRDINTYFNQIRRKTSILERPFVSGRGEGKSYCNSSYAFRFS